jgi:serine/threonine protein kinase
LLSALNYLHSCTPHIIHRDVKPANILVDLSPHIASAKLTDFDVSLVVSDRSAQFYDMVGTRGYMAPEVINKDGYGSLVDVYSAGCVAYAAVTGEAPFANLAPTASYDAVVAGKEPMLMVEVETQLPELLSIIRAMWRPKSDRPDARVLLQELQRL